MTKERFYKSCQDFIQMLQFIHSSITKKWVLEFRWPCSWLSVCHQTQSELLFTGTLRTWSSNFVPFKNIPKNIYDLTEGSKWKSCECSRTAVMRPLVAQCCGERGQWAKEGERRRPGFRTQWRSQINTPEAAGVSIRLTSLPRRLKTTLWSMGLLL